MSHASAALTPKHRLKVARLVVDLGYSMSEVATRFQCSRQTVKRWGERYLAGEPMTNRCSRPHCSPNKTRPEVVKRIVSLRLRKRLDPPQLGALCAVAPSTARRVLTRCKLNRLSHTDRATGEVVQRYEYPTADDMMHVDVTKFGNILDGGEWRFVGTIHGARHRAATPGKPRSV